MILDIKFNNEPPKQLQDVRMVTVYFDWDEDSTPCLAIHFNKFESGMESYDLALLKSIQFTND